MRKSLIIMLLAMIGLLTAMHRQNRALREEAERLAANYRAMTDTVTARRSTSGRSVRAVQTLSLTPEELTAPLFAQRLATVRDIGVKSKRVNELTTVGTETRVEVKLQPLPASPEGEKRGVDNAGAANGVGAMDVSAKRSAAEFGANVIARSDDRATTSYKYRDPWVDIAVQPLPTSPKGEESDVDDSEALPFRGGLGGAAAATISLVIRDTLTLVEHRVPRRIWFFRFGTKCVRREVVASCPYTEVVMAERIVAVSE